MIQKPTTELLDSLKNSETIQNYLSECKKDFVKHPIGQYLNDLALEKGLSKSEIFAKAELNEIYGYQIFGDIKNPSRDKLLCICLGMELSLSEVTTVLKYAGYAVLYPRDRRDSIILYGILNKADIYQINEWLYDADEKTLS